MGLDVETAGSVVGGVGGAAGVFGLLKAFYNDWCSRSDKAEMNKRIDAVADEIGTHAVLDAQTYATREDQAALYAHIDRKFESLQTLIINVIKDGNGVNHKTRN